MKKIIVVFALLLSLSAIAQNFPERRPQLLIGKELKVIPFKITEYEKGYKDFYSDIEMRKTYLEKEKYSSFTPIEQLEGRVFKVTAVQASDPTDKNYSRLTLVDEAKGETLYYKYDSRFEKDFHFEVVGGLKLPADFYCDFIETKVDKFEGETTYTSSAEDGIVFTKKKKGTVTVYLMRINALSKEKYEGKGAIVLLSNTKRISKPNAEVVVSELDEYGNYRYTTMFSLTIDDVNLLMANTITDARVIKADSEVKEGIKLKGMFDCLITK